MVKNGNAFVKNPANFFNRFHFPENNHFLWFSLPSVTIYYHKRLINSQNNLQLIYRIIIIFQMQTTQNKFTAKKELIRVDFLLDKSRKQVILSFGKRGANEY